MGMITLITGGTRSGKSDFAQQRAETIVGSRCFIATCAATDDEMLQRIARHRAKRDPNRWDCVEEPLHLDAVIRANRHYDVLLVDCLTLWISNLMYDLEVRGGGDAEALVERLTLTAVEQLRDGAAAAILVSGEVGLGIVPVDKVSRLYRDLVGLCNRIVAAEADEVIFVSCGLPLQLKPRKDMI